MSSELERIAVLEAIVPRVDAALKSIEGKLDPVLECVSRYDERIKVVERSAARLWWVVGTIALMLLGAIVEQVGVAFLRWIGGATPPVGGM